MRPRPPLFRNLDRGGFGLCWGELVQTIQEWVSEWMSECVCVHVALENRVFLPYPSSLLRFQSIHTASEGKHEIWPQENMVFLSYIYFLNIYLFLRESTSTEGTEREGNKESKAGSRLWAVSTEPNVWLELINHEIMTWAKVGHLTDWATQAPLKREI